MAKIGAERIEETSTTEISKKKLPEGLIENITVARKGGNVAKKARLEIEKQTEGAVVSCKNAKKHLGTNE